MSRNSRDVSGRVPPYSMESELAILGSILLNNRSLAIVSKFITAEDFYAEANKVIFTAMVDMAAIGKPIDTVTVGTHLMDKGMLQKIGGAKAFDGLTEKVATVKNVQYYAQNVKELSARRQMIYAAQQIVADGFEGTGLTTEYLAASRKVIVEAANSIQAIAGPQQIDKDVSEIYQQQIDGKPPEGLVKTGIDIIDRMTGGLWPKMLTTVAARPSMGKSAFGMNIVSNIAISQGKKVLIFTLEDVREVFVTRMLARYADIDLSKLMLRNINTKEEWSRLTDACSMLSRNHNLWIEDASGLTSAQIAQMVAYHKEVYGIDLVVIDHLSELRDPGDNETQRVTNAARGVRDACKELGIPAMLLAQLNRELEKRPNKRPVLSDLRQSGEVEQVSRAVWFLHRPGYYIPDGQERRDMELIIAKTNHGKTGMLKMWCDLSRMYMKSWDVQEHGLWPGDEGGDSITSARHKSEERSRGENQRGFNFNGGGVHDPEEDY